MEVKMNNLGYYYSEGLKTVIIGFRDQNGRLVGKVIGHTTKAFWGHAFNYGYTYKQWAEGFFFVARLRDYGSLKNYLNYLQAASTKQIEAYFKIKDVVLEQHGSRILKKQIDGRTYRYIISKAA
jgi:hypothetical protein